MGKLNCNATFLKNCKELVGSETVTVLSLSTSPIYAIN